MTTPALVPCPSCGGGGEIVECRDPGLCSHILDRVWQCRCCSGTGQVTAERATEWQQLEDPAHEGPS